jgi:2-dehydropantoate 2-reductase
VCGGGSIAVLFTALLSLSRSPPLTLLISPHLSSLLSAPSALPLSVRLLPSTLSSASSSTASLSPLTIAPSTVFPSASSLLSSPLLPARIHYILIAVKGVNAVHRACEQIRLLLQHSPDAVIAPIMNGVAHVSLIPQLLQQSAAATGPSPSPPIVFASTAQGAHFSSPYVLQQAGDGPTSFVLPPPPVLALSFRQLVQSAPLRSVWLPHDRLLPVMWSKLLVNAVVNPLTALLGVRNGWLLDWMDGDGKQLVAGVVREVLQVGRRQGVRFILAGREEEEAGEEGRGERPAADAKEEETELAAALETVRRVVIATAGNVSSTLADVRAGRRTELDAMNGEVVRQGQRLGVDTPYNTALYELVRAQTAAAVAGGKSSAE